MIFVVRSGYSSVELERRSDLENARAVALAYLKKGHGLVSIWQGNELIEQIELVRSRSDRFAGAKKRFGTHKSPVLFFASRAANLSDRERRGAA